nr:iron-containing alcohol dehydrogenase family protein [Desulforamulus aquiferis]
MSKAPQVCSKLAKNPLVVGGEKALQAASEKINNSFMSAQQSVPDSILYGGECCESNIQRVVQAAQSTEADMLIAVGGGKVLDTVKIAAFRLNIPLVTVPTIASNCAPWTPLSILYDNNGKFLEMCFEAAMPEAIFVDPEIVAEAPVRYLIAGMGDTLAKWYETEISTQNKFGSAVIGLAKASAHLCYQTIIETGQQAIEAVNQQLVKPELEEVIDAIILLSGTVSCMGGDDCRTAAAHAIYSGLTGVHDIHEKSLHGEMVAFGILVQLVLDNKEQEAIKLAKHYRNLFLPCNLAELGLLNCTEGDLTTIIEGTLATDDIKNMPYEVTAVMLKEAIISADLLGQKI